MAPVRLGQGPRIGERETLLWCAWQACRRLRRHPDLGPDDADHQRCLDETLRRFGGNPTYALTDNERTVTIDRIASIAVKHPVLVAAGRHYGVQIYACVPADPTSKAEESTVKVARADLVPTEAKLLEEYASFTELWVACDAAARRSMPASTARRGGSRSSAWPTSAGGCTPCPTSHSRSPSASSDLSTRS